MIAFQTYMDADRSKADAIGALAHRGMKATDISLGITEVERRIANVETTNIYQTHLEDASWALACKNARSFVMLNAPLNECFFN